MATRTRMGLSRDQFVVEICELMVWHLASAEACRNEGRRSKRFVERLPPGISMEYQFWDSEIILDDSGKKPLGHSQRTPTYKVSAKQYSAALTNSEALNAKWTLVALWALCEAHRIHANLKLQELRCLRDLLAHKNGIVDQYFLERFGSSPRQIFPDRYATPTPYRLGDKVFLTSHSIKRAWELIGQVVPEILPVRRAAASK